MDRTALDSVLARQEGVVSRKQVLALAGNDDDIARLLRRRELARVFEGVYVNHTGEPSESQRWWAAVLCHAPSALDGASALRAYGVDIAASRLVELVVPGTRRVHAARGLVVRRLSRFDATARMSLTPPRVRLEHAALQAASSAPTDEGALALLADLCQQGWTTPARLAAAIADRTRLRRRAFLMSVLDDVAAGSYSVLERRYLVQVERAHGLPTAARQRRVLVGRAAAYRDVEYVPYGVIVELDGRLGHERARDRWRDLDRDLAAGADGVATVRLGWRQVLDPCRTASVMARLLWARGWRGTLRSCGSCIGDSQAPGAGDPPMSVA